MRDDIEDAEKALEDCVRKMKENKRQRMLSEIQTKIREAEKKKDLELIKKLQIEQHQLLKPNV